MVNPVAALDPFSSVWDLGSRVGQRLRGRRGFVVGIANEHSIAYGCAGNSVRSVRISPPPT